MADASVGDGTGGGPTGVAAGHGSPGGRDTVAERVYSKIAEYTAATVIGVSRSDATVDVAQYRDGIALRVRTPLPVPALDDTVAIGAGRARSGPGRRDPEHPARSDQQAVGQGRGACGCHRDRRGHRPTEKSEMTDSALQRVVRRETHSPRTVAMIIAVVIVILALLYLALEVVLSLLGQPALLVSPGAMMQWLVDLPVAQPAALIIAGGIVLALIGLVLVVLALAPGHLAKHRMQDGERAVVVDNGVIAAAVAQHVSEETGLAREDITVGVSHRTVDVTLRPAPGIPLEEAEVKSAVIAELDAYQLTPAVKPRVRIVRAKESEDDR